MLPEPRPRVVRKAFLGAFSSLAPALVVFEERVVGISVSVAAAIVKVDSWLEAVKNGLGGLLNNLWEARSTNVQPAKEFEGEKKRCCSRNKFKATTQHTGVRQAWKTRQLSTFTRGRIENLHMRK